MSMPIELDPSRLSQRGVSELWKRGFATDLGRIIKGETLNDGKVFSMERVSQFEIAARPEEPLPPTPPGPVKYALPNIPIGFDMNGAIYSCDISYEEFAALLPTQYYPGNIFSVRNANTQSTGLTYLLGSSSSGSGSGNIAVLNMYYLITGYPNTLFSAGNGLPYSSATWPFTDGQEFSRSISDAYDTIVASVELDQAGEALSHIFVRARED